MLVHRPDVYQEIYDAEGNLHTNTGLSPEEEKDIDWVIPESEADVDSMMAELRELGYKG